MERDVDIISLVELESHRFRCIRSHESMSSENRERDMHDEILVFFIHRWSIGRWWHVTESVDSSLEFSSEYGTVELERFLGSARKVQVGGCLRHMRKNKEIEFVRNIKMRK